MAADRDHERGAPEGQGEEAKAEKRARRRAKKIATKARTRATACRRCRSSPSTSTASTGSSASHRSSSPFATSTAIFGMSADEVQHAIHEQFRAYRATLQDDRRHLLERFEVVDVARKVVGVGSVGTRAFIVLLQGRDRAGPAVPAGQGSHRVGAGGPPAEEPLQAARRTGRAGAADDAGRQRHLPRLDQGRAGQPLPLLAPAPRHEGLGRGRVDDADRPRRSTPALRLDPRPRARPLRRPGRHRRLPRQERQVRPSRSPTSPSATPTRTNRTTRPSRDAVRSGRLEAIEGV